MSNLTRYTIQRALFGDGYSIYPVDGGEWVKYDDIKDKIDNCSPSANQQLKAEIAALANELEAHCKDRSYVLLDRFITRMRQLSAV